MFAIGSTIFHLSPSSPNEECVLYFFLRVVTKPNTISKFHCMYCMYSVVVSLFYIPYTLPSVTTVLQYVFIQSEKSAGKLEGFV